MKKLYYLLILFLPSLSGAQTWDWARKAYSPGSEAASKVITDSQNNSYVIGYGYTDSMVCQGVTIQSNYGGNGMYIISFDPEGNALWGKTFKFSVSDIVIDNTSSIYISGTFQDSVLTLDGFTLVKDPGATWSMCMVKMSASGNVISAFKATAGNSSFLGRLAADSDGAIFMTGAYWGDSISFGPVTLHNANPFFVEYFICKMNASGTFDWAIPLSAYYTASSSNMMWLESIAAKTDHSLAVALSFTDSVFVIGNDTIRTNYGLPHTLVAKFDGSGNVQSHYLMNGGNIYMSMAGDNSNNLLLGGSFGSDSLLLGSVVLSNPYASGGSRGGFLAKMKDDGTFSWTASIGADIHCIATDHSDNVIIGGQYGWNLILGNDTLRSPMDPPHQGKPFLASYDMNGNFLWSKNATFQGSEWDDMVNGVAVGTDNSVYACGDYSSDTLRFDTTMLVNSHIYHGFPNTTEMFVGKIVPADPSFVNETDPGSVLFYPNPSTGIIKITSRSRIKNVKVYDLCGRNCLDLAANAEETEVSLLGLLPGVYILTIQDADKTSIRKLILEH